MNENKGFTLIEIIVSLLITSIILIVLIPNLLNEYKGFKELEEKLELKEILYEEIINHKNKEFTLERNNYEIVVNKDNTYIKNKNNNVMVNYEKK